MCELLAFVEISGSVERIGDYAFAGRDFLTGVKIPDSVDSIGEQAFAMCGNLINVLFEGDRKSMDVNIERAFHGTAWLASVYGSIPELDSSATVEDVAAALKGSADGRLL